MVDGRTPFMAKNAVHAPTDRQAISSVSGIRGLNRRQSIAEIGKFRQRRLIAVPQTGKKRLHPRRDLPIHADGLGQRINVGSFFFQREMEMWPCGQSCRPNPSDHLAHMDPRSGLDVGTYPREMPINAGKTSLMLDSNRIAQFSRPSRLLNTSIR